jgi:hypothetical protein
MMGARLLSQRALTVYGGHEFAAHEIMTMNDYDNNDSDNDNENHGLSEDVCLLVGVGMAVLCVSAGIGLALAYDDPHWLNRAGAGVVAVQLVAVMIEFSRRRRLHAIERAMSAEQSLSEEGWHLLESEVAKSETQAFAVVIGLAAVGELLHGFGDLLFATVFR